MKHLRDCVLDWMDERFQLRALLTWAKHKSVPVHKTTVFYYTGGVCLFLFLVQILSGILLLMYYRVGVDASYESVHYIASQVEFGWLVRAIHSWSANLLILFIFIHMFSVYFMKAYRKPRELSWIIGCMLLGVMMAFGFSGYLLPWNELAFYATKVGTDIIGELPVVGHWLLKVVRGGDDVTGATLSRFFGLHVAILPAIATGLICFHLVFVQVQGMSHSGKSTKRMPFFPNFVLRDIMLWLLVLNILYVLAVFLPWELGKKADPLLAAPAGIKPEWYFLANYQLLKVIPAKILFIPGELVGIIVFSLAGLFWMLVPFWDTKIVERKRDKIVNLVGGVGLFVMLALSIWGYLS